MSLLDELQTTLAPAYRLESELGGGGMSRVFLAEETRFRRRVVVKVLTPELAAGVSAERFEREILLAAQLVHPSIVPVLTAGEANGLPYYTMPFVEGESLRSRLVRQSPLPINEAVSLLRDVARALTYAHERGIVHRDIKPENVLVSGGGAVVTDFGIAKAISAARSPTASDTLTTAGTSIGTPAYMAPEQVTGDPTVGGGADLYSFGCLAFELLTGAPPFQGRAMHRVMAAHISEPPPDILTRRPDCPPGLGRLIMQCLEKETEKRPAGAADLVRVLESTTTPPDHVHPPIPAPHRYRLPRAAAFVLGALVVLGGAWILVKPRGDGTPATAPGSTLRSIAVLPFANVGGDTADAYFADGVGEELATALSKVAGLRVVARNSTFRSGDRAMDEAEAGKALGVDALIVGSVRRSGSQLRLTARLVQVSDGSILWSDQFVNEVKDVFQVQDSVTRSIMAALRLQLAGGPDRSPSVAGTVAGERGTSSLAAYDLYLRGQFALHRRNVRMAVDFFRQAIALDPNYPRAYAGLSAGLVLLPYFAEVPSDSVREPAATAARTALSLDSTLAEAHTSLGLVYMHANQWKESEAEHRRAVALDPTDAAAQVQLGRLLLATGRVEDAARAFERAESLDPFSAVAAAWVSNTAIFVGQNDAALVAARRAVALDSNVAPANQAMARAFLAAGKRDSAILMADRLPKLSPWTGMSGYIHAVAGDLQGARRILREIRSRAPTTWASATSMAWILFGLGDSAGGLVELERATDRREIWPNWFTIYDFVYNSVRNDPKFAEIGKRVGLDVTQFRSAARRTP